MNYIKFLRQYVGHEPILTAGVGLFVFNENKEVLMQLRTDYNQWGFPGGAMELGESFEQTAKRELKEETGVENVKVLNDDIFSLEIICVNGHVKRGKYVSSHVHLNLTYLLEVDENEILKIKEDENSGVKWVPIEDVEKVSTEKWVVENVYKKINFLRFLWKRKNVYFTIATVSAAWNAKYAIWIRQKYVTIAANV